MTKGAWTWPGRVFRAVLGPERLDDLPAPPADRDGRSFFAWLLESEELPVDEATVGMARASVLRVLFSPEALPLDQAAGPRPRHPAGRRGDGRAV